MKYVDGKTGGHILPLPGTYGENGLSGETKKRRKGEKREKGNKEKKMEEKLRKRSI